MTSVPVGEPVRLPPRPVLLIVLAGLGMIGPFTIDTIFPAFQHIQAEFNSSAVEVQQTITVYLLAFAVMSLLHGPVSDSLGRKPVILVGLGIYAAAALGCSLAPNLPLLLAFRALQGASAGAGQIVSRAIVRDILTGHDAQRMMSHISMLFGLAPAMAPILGGVLLQWGPWRAIFWFLVTFGVLLVLAVGFLMPETHPPSQRTLLRFDELGRSLWQIWADPNGRRLALTGMANFAGNFLYISSAPMFIVTLLGKGEQDFWLLFVPNITGMVLGSWTSGRLAGRVDGRTMASWGFLVSIVGGLLELGFSLVPATAQLPWIVLPLPLYTFGIATGFPIITLAMLDLFPTNRGAASSVQSFVSLAANAVVSGLVAPFVSVSLWSLAAGALTFTTMAWALWQRHLRMTRIEPKTTPEPEGYEPTNEM